MKHSKLIAAAGAAILTGGVSMALAPVASAAAPPWEQTNPNSVGTITFYDASGNQITSGNIDDHPIAAYAVGSATVEVGDNDAAVRTAQPNPNANIGLWNVDTLGAFTTYPLTSGPANIKTLSQTHPVATGANTDLSLNDFIGEFPNTDPSGIGCAYAPMPSGCTNTAYENIYQVRLITGLGAHQSTQYDVADVLVDPNAGTWTQVYGGAPAQDNASLTISGPSSVSYAGTAKLTTALKDTTTNTAMVGAHLVLKRRANSSKPWTTVGTVTTVAAGAASKSVALTANTQFEWTYAGDSTHKASISAVKSVSVAQVIAIHSTKSSVAHGVAFKVWGSVKPAGSGQKVTLQHLVGTTWRNGPTATLTKQKMPNGSTTVGYVFTVKESAKGTYRFRVQKGATSTLAAGTSPTVTVKIT